MTKNGGIAIVLIVMAATLLALVYMSIDREIVLPTEPAPSPAPAEDIQDTSHDQDPQIIEVPVRFLDWTTDEPVKVDSIQVTRFGDQEFSLPVAGGKAMLPMNPEGLCCFTFEAAGYTRMDWCLDERAIAGGADIYLINPSRFDPSIWSLRGPTITVKDGTTGEPIEAAMVTTRNQERARDSRGSCLGLSLTDVEGKLLLWKRWGYDTIEIWNEGYTPTITTFDAVWRDPEVFLWKNGEAGARGKLLEGGAPVEAVLVPELLLGRDNIERAVEQQTLDAEGAFEWTDMPPGLYAIRILREGDEVWGSFPVEVEGGFMSEGTLDLNDFGRVQGQASAITYAGVIHAELALVDHPDLPLYRQPVDDSGNFEFAYVPAETYIIRLVDEYGNERRITHPINPGETGTIRLAAPLVE